MRLIDADTLKAKLAAERMLLQIVCRIIDERPTIFDVDKVMEDMQMLADKTNDNLSLLWHPYFDGKQDGLKEAIEIVKKGGKRWENH